MAGLSIGTRDERLPVPRDAGAGLWWAGLVAALVAGLSACSGGGSVNISNSQAGDAATLDYPIFYVKRAIPTDAAGNVIQDDLRVMNDVVPTAADLYKRAAASPSARSRCNSTAASL